MTSVHNEHKAFIESVIDSTYGGVDKEAVRAAFEKAIGQVIREVSIESSALCGYDEIKIRFDHGALVIWDGGQSCCESRYVTTDDDLEHLVGATLLDVGKRDGTIKSDDDYDEVHEIQFMVVTTSKGAATFATHNEHNGYYGGFDLMVAWHG